MQRLLGLFHHLVYVLARFEKRGRVALAAEKRGGRAEVAAHRAADARNDRRARRPDLLRQFQPHPPSGRIRRRSADAAPGASASSPR